MIPSDIWTDQEDFNRTLRPEAGDPVALTKELALHLISECDSVLQACGVWKLTRTGDPVNRARLAHEMIDVLKYWMSIAQTWGLTPEELRTAYWDKSAAVRQRFAEHAVWQAPRQSVIFDLDNVLADYSTGFGQFLLGKLPMYRDEIVRQMRQRCWFDPVTLGQTGHMWGQLKHEFRVNGGFRHLPLMPFAQLVVQKCRNQGLTIIVLTSRPIDRYPNIYVDTVGWLTAHQMMPDVIWWGVDKAERLKEAQEHTNTSLLEHVRFAVDDDPRFIAQYAQLGIPAYWVQSTDMPGIDPPSGDRVTCIPSLSHLL